jgi:hypothetical protein
MMMSLREHGDLMKWRVNQQQKKTQFLIIPQATVLAVLRDNLPLEE